MAGIPPTSSQHLLTWKFDYPVYHAETRQQWRTWLAASHESDRGERGERTQG